MPFDFKQGTPVKDLSAEGFKFDSGSTGFEKEAPVQEIAPEKSGYQKYSENLGSFSKGVAKGGLSTLQGLGAIGQWMLDQTAGRGVNLLAGKGFTPTGADGSMGDVYRDGTEANQNVKDALVPEGTAENLGFATERIAEFLAPSSAISKWSAPGTIIGGLKTVPRLLAQGAIEGTVAGGMTTIQNQEFDDRAKLNALISFAAPSVFHAVSKLGSKFLEANIKPSTADVKNGFKIENVKKYDVGGPLKTSLSKTSEKINQASKQLDTALEGSPATVDIQGVFKKTADQLKDKKSLVFGQIKDVNSGIDELAEDLMDIQKAFEGELGDMASVPIKIANNQIKRGAGLKGAWSYGRIDKNSEAIDKVYSVFYSNLKDAINKVGPAAIRTANKVMEDLIPVQSALIRRIPVAERANVIGIGENMALAGAVFDPRALYLLLPQIAQKSGTFGNFLMKAAESWSVKAAGAGVKATVSGRG